MMLNRGTNSGADSRHFFKGFMILGTPNLQGWLLMIFSEFARIRKHTGGVSSMQQIQKLLSRFKGSSASLQSTPLLIFRQWPSEAQPLHSRPFRAYQALQAEPLRVCWHGLAQIQMVVHSRNLRTKRQRLRVSSQSRRVPLHP